MNFEFKKIAFGDNFLRFSVVRKVFYAFLYHKKLYSRLPNLLIRNATHVILFIAVIWFIFVVCIPEINIPEIGVDEALVGNVTLQLINNSPEIFFGIVFLGRHLPIMTTPHHGAVESYLLFPFLFFGGATLEALRSGPIFYGVVIIILTYYFCRKFFHPIAGLISVVLLVTNSFFLCHIKLGGIFGFSLPIFTLSSLLFFLKWRDTRKNIYFGLGMFFLALGFQVKGWFIWFIISAFISGWFLYARRNKIKIKTILIGLLSMFLGLIPVLYYNLKTSFYNKFVSQNAIITTHCGINNLEFIRNLHIRIEQLNDILRGPAEMPYGLRMFPIFFFRISLCWLLYLIFVKKRTALSKQRISFILLLFSLTLIMSAYTFTSLADGHLFILFPYIQILMGIAVFEAVKSEKHKLSTVIAIPLLFLVIIVHLGRCAEIYHNLKIEKVQIEKCTMRLLARWLLENKIYNPTCFFEADHPLTFYSNFKIRPHYFPEGDLWSSIKEATINSPTLADDVFIFTWNDYNESVDKSIKHKIFKSIAEEFNKETVIRKRFLFSNGNTRMIVYSLK